MIEYLLKLITDNQSDISVCQRANGRKTVKENKIIHEEKEENVENKVVGKSLSDFDLSL